MSNEPLAIEDHFHQLLDTIAELVTGTVAVAFVASEDRGTWTAPRSHEALAGLAGTVRQQLDDRAEGGLVDGVLADRAVWVEPAFGGAEDGERAAQAGALGIARLVPAGVPAPFSQGEIDAIRVVAKLCGSATGVADMTRELEYQRQIEELVSQVAERLMATTNETMSASLDWTVETLALYLKADSAFLRRNDHANGVSILMAEYPERDAPDPDPLAVVAFDVDPIFAATRDLKGPLVMRNPEAMDTDYTKRVEDAGVAVAFSGAGVPLIYGDVTEGCLAFVRFSALDWADHEISALRMVGVAARPLDAPARDGRRLATAGDDRRADRAAEPAGAAGRDRPATAGPERTAPAALRRPRPLQGDERLPGPRRRRQAADDHRRPDPGLGPAGRLRRPARR